MQTRRTLCSASTQFCIVILVVIAVQSTLVRVHGDDSIDLDKKQRAILELEKRRRELAEKELELNRQEQRQREERLDRARKTLTNAFELDERGLIPRPERITKTLQRLQHQRDTTKFAMLQFREKWVGAIKSGEALNVFLRECGPVAFEHSFYRRIANPAGGDGKGEKQLLDQLVLDYKLPEEVTRHILHRKGLIGSKLSGRLNQGPLNLDWPLVLRADQFKANRVEIEKLRNNVLAELKKGHPVSNVTADKLLKETEDFLKKVRKEAKKQIMASNGSSRAFQPYNEAVKFSEVLVAGAYRFVEGFSLGDVTFEKFEGGNIEDLLAYMHRNNLEFIRSDVNGESAYFMLFDMLTRYYVDLYALKLAIAEEYKTLGKMKEDEASLRDIAFGNSMSAMQKVEVLGDLAGAFSSAMNALGKK